MLPPDNISHFWIFRNSNLKTFSLHTSHSHCWLLLQFLLQHLLRNFWKLFRCPRWKNKYSNLNFIFHFLGNFGYFTRFWFICFIFQFSLFVHVPKFSMFVHVPKFSLFVHKKFYVCSYLVTQKILCRLGLTFF